ncbi:MAG: hypothetical protein H6Q41_5495 [Deltaproteobacteria bacterium]|nr:hypothetical protein [Deltaproteobacteria bacterium]
MSWLKKNYNTAFILHHHNQYSTDAMVLMPSRSHKNTTLWQIFCDWCGECSDVCKRVIKFMLLFLDICL